MIPFQRLHEESSLCTSLEGYDQDLWRLTYSQAYHALANKSCFPAMLTARPAPTLLLLATDATYFARSLTTRLSLSSELTECLIIARLLGFPAGGEPSGHIISRLMQKHGGFVLMDQSLRIVDELENVFPEFNGLNLSWDIRHALGALPCQFLKTPREAASYKVDHALAGFAIRLSTLQLNLLHFPAEPREGALQECSLWRNLQGSISATYPHLESRRMFRFTLHRFLLRLLDEASLPTGTPDVTLVPNSESSLRDLESRLENQRKQIRENSPPADQLDQAFISVFHHLCAHNHLIPEKLSLRIKKDGVHRVICDHLVGLGDQQLLALHQEWTPSPPINVKTQMELL